MTDKIWICGKVSDYPAWELVGVFDEKAKAASAAESSFRASKGGEFFIAPAILNICAPASKEFFQDIEWPQFEAQKQEHL